MGFHFKIFFAFLKSPNKVLAIFEIPKPKEIDYNSTIIAFEEINDPGNLGTIIRICDWFGIKDIICSKKSVDCYNPKVIQSTMGSIARVKCHYIDLIPFLSKYESTVYGATLDGKTHYHNLYDKKGILVADENFLFFRNIYELPIHEEFEMFSTDLLQIIHGEKGWLCLHLP